MMKWQSTPRLRTLPLLWVMWWIVAHGLLLASQLYSNWDAPQGMKDLGWKDMGLILYPPALTISGTLALILCVAHFILWRSGLWRRRKVKLAVTIIVSLLGTGVVLWVVDTRKYYYKNAGLFGVYGTAEYKELANNRLFDELVRRMEEDCAYFNKAKDKMGGKIVVRSSNHGFSYLFVNMQDAWDSVIRLAPRDVISTLQDARYDGDVRGNIGGYGEWRPLAERLRESDTPILRALGAFMLEDMDGFAEAAYQLADEDPDALALATFASTKDPVPTRAIERMLRYHSMETYKAFPHHSRDHVKAHLLNKLKSFTFQGLDDGTLDEPLKARLRELPWVQELPENYRRLLGVEE